MMDAITGVPSMPSPFPGMNPYIEKPGLWKDFHTSFLPALRAALMPQVAPNYFVRIEQHIYVDEPQNGSRRARIADVDLHLKNGHRPPAAPSAVATTTPPKKLRVPRVTKRRVGYLTVRTVEGQHVVTVIELLSPANKDGSSDQESYLVKRRELLASDTNFVEIDLLRGGTRMPITGLKACDYYTLVSRPLDRPTVDVCPVKLRERLPVIPVPLKRGVPEPTVDLKAILDRVYDEAGYAYAIYDDPPEPPLSPADAAWAKGVIAKSVV
jgi:hypothetical protein